MTTRATPPTAPTALPPLRRAYRHTEGTYFGGVCAGLAEHLGVDVTWVRAFFVITAAFGFGLVLYAGLWLTLPQQVRTFTEPPGLAAAGRQGKRPGRAVRLTDAGPLVALAILGLGVVALLDAILGGPALLWPAMIAMAGLLVLWRQADEAQRERWIDSTGRLGVTRILVGDGGWAGWTRLAVGLGLLVVALVMFAVQTGRYAVALNVMIATLLGIVGLSLVLGPWVVRLLNDLTQERAERVRTQERADVAAHLHDSVLQTLALIRNNADDPAQVSKLARAQERDLREWMFGEGAFGQPTEATLAHGLKSAAAEVEDLHAVPVEVVTVGDVPMTDDVHVLVAAAKEGMVNAAKHSGAARIDVYAEVSGVGGDRKVEVFVRDRGRGFDLATVPMDRLGVRNSIVDRMERHGGTAGLRSEVGAGTEVTLGMMLGPDPSSEEGR